MSSSRRNYTKSHTGCQQCKKRKVKCDESLPSCKRCLQRRAQCSYLEFSNLNTTQAELRPAQPQLHTQPLSFTNSSSESNGSTTQNTPQSAVTSPAVTLPGPVGTTDDFHATTLMNIELTHFFTTMTYKTIIPGEHDHALWRDDIFQSSLTQPALLSGLLSTAALHKITLLDSWEAKSRYTDIALRTQGSAFKALIAISNNPNPGNCEALFCLSLLLTVWAFASKNLPPELNILEQSPFEHSYYGGATRQTHGRSSITDFVKIVAISQGIHAVVRETYDWLGDRDVKALMARLEPDTLPPIGDDIGTALDDLEAFLRSSASPESDSPDLDPSELATFIEALNTLRLNFRIIPCPEWHERIMSWPIRLPPHFLQALKQGRAPALTIMAYWARCFYVLDDLWWVNGWPKALVLDARAVVPNPWRRYLDWPAQVFINSP